jgi:hypothetical protein
MLDPDPYPDPHKINADPQPWIQALRDTCKDHGVDSGGFWLRRLCLNTVLNENIAGRRAAFRAVLLRSRKYGRRIQMGPIKTIE